MWKSLDKTYWIKKKNLYLLNDGSGDKKSKRHKIVCHGSKNQKNCLEATQLDNKRNYTKKIKLAQIDYFATNKSLTNS